MTEPAVLHASAAAGEPSSSFSRSCILLSPCIFSSSCTFRSFFLLLLNLLLYLLHLSILPILIPASPEAGLSAQVPAARPAEELHDALAIPRFVFNFAWVAARTSRGLLGVLGAQARFLVLPEGRAAPGRWLQGRLCLAPSLPSYLLLPVSCRQGRAGQLCLSLTHTFCFNSPTLYSVCSPQCLPAS